MKKYYLAIKAKRKNAKRHLYGTHKRLLNAVEAVKTYDEIERSGIYIPEICTGNWQHVDINELRTIAYIEGSINKW